MYFDMRESKNAIFKRIARNNESIFTENLQLAQICEQGPPDFHHTPLSVACQTGSLHYVYQLLAIKDVSKNDRNFDNLAPQIATDQGDLALVKRLVEISDIRNHINDEFSKLGHFEHPTRSNIFKM